MLGHPRPCDNINHAKCKVGKQPLVHCLISCSFCSFCVAVPTESYALSCKTIYVFTDLCYYAVMFLSFVSVNLQEERALICYMAPVNDFANGF